MSDRWIVGDFAWPGPSRVPPFFECIAVSKSGDPTALNGWWFYAIRTDDAAQ